MSCLSGVKCVLVKALFCHPLMTDAFAIDSRDSRQHHKRRCVAGNPRVIQVAETPRDRAQCRQQIAIGLSQTAHATATSIDGTIENGLASCRVLGERNDRRTGFPCEVANAGELPYAE